MLAQALWINRDAVIRRNNLSHHSQLDARGLNAAVESVGNGVKKLGDVDSLLPYAELRQDHADMGALDTDAKSTSHGFPSRSKGKGLVSDHSGASSSSNLQKHASTKATVREWLGVQAHPLDTAVDARSSRSSSTTSTDDTPSEISSGDHLFEGLFDDPSKAKQANNKARAWELYKENHEIMRQEAELDAVARATRATERARLARDPEQKRMQEHEQRLLERLNQAFVEHSQLEKEELGYSAVDTSSARVQLRQKMKLLGQEIRTLRDKLVFIEAQQSSHALHHGLN